MLFVRHDSYKIVINAPVAQLAEALDLGSRGCEFESRLGYKDSQFDYLKILE